MRFIVPAVLAGLLVVWTNSEAAAFGRGAPPHVGSPAPRPGVAVGPIGGVHHAPYAPPHISVPHAPVAPPHVTIPHVPTVPPRVGVVTSPWGGVHPGVVHPGSVHVGTGGVVVRPPGTVVRPGGTGGYVVIRPNPVGGSVRVGHYTGYVSPANLRGIGVGIRGVRYPYFTPAWYRTHVGLWYPRFWVGGVGIWFVPPWATLAPFVGITAPPIVYDYGSTVVIQDGTVYQNGEIIGPAADYAAQAITLEATGRAAMLADTDQWQPLGVFGLIQGNETTAQRIFQLAVNKNGIVRGNYYDAIADNTLPVYGAIDTKTQRVAWSIGDKRDIVFETGLNNLLQNETTVLVHYGKEGTQQMVLVRLPEQQGK